MKKLILVFILFICHKLNAQKIQGEVIYNISYNTEQINKLHSLSKKNKNKYFLKILKNTKDVKGKLLFSSHTSLYNIDNNLKKENRKNEKTNLTKMKGGGENVFFVNLINNEVIKQDCKLLGECFLISNPIYKWKLSNQTKIVGGKKCFVATTTELFDGKKFPISACYTPEIPYMYGPKDYSGLPGLILQLNDGLVTFTATKITMKKTENPSINLPKGKKVSEKEFDELCKKSFPKELFNN